MKTGDFIRTWLYEIDRDDDVGLEASLCAAIKKTTAKNGCERGSCPFAADCWPGKTGAKIFLQKEFEKLGDC